MRAGKLSQFLHQPTGQIGHSRVGFHRDGAPWPALGTINVIFAKPRDSVRASSRVMSVVGGFDLEDRGQVPKRAKVMATLTLGFSEEDKEGMF